MKKLALLALVALEICVCACGNNAPTSIINTQSGNSNWEAQLHGGAGQDSLLDFVTQFPIGENGGTIVPYFFGFINQGACFPSGVTASGSAVLTTNSSDQVTGTLTFTVTSAESTLTLNGSVSGTSSGSTSSIGNMTNGVVQGTWYLTTTLPSTSGCNAVGSSSGSGNPPFLMCQGAATCTVP
jgi:hypothetical protein